MKHRLIRFVCILMICLLACSPALAYEKLQRGSSGEEVLCMQMALKSLGYSINTDGKYGYQSEQYIKSFQRRVGLTADGIAGDKTLTELYALAPEYAPKTTSAPQATATPRPTATVKPTATPTPKPTDSGGSSSGKYEKLTKGSSGEEVLRMQQALKKLGYTITVDGKYGYESEKVVKSFQRKNGLTADGVAGEKTLYVLYSLASGEATPAPASPTPTATPTATPTNAPTMTSVPGGIQALVVTGGGSLNLRASADGDAAVLASIPTGEWIVVTARGDTWSKAAYNGVSGYVMSKYLSFGAQTATALPTATPTIAPTSTASASGITAYVQTSGGTLNLRANARSNAKILTTIPFGTALTITSRGSTWCATSYNGYSGYVMTSFLRFQDTATATPTTAPTSTPTAQPGSTAALVTTSGGTVNLRAEASSNARVLASVPNGTALTVRARGDTWTAVNYNGVQGYMMTKYLTFLATAPTATATAAPTAAPSGATAEEDDPSAFTRVLKKGMTGEDVAWVQSRLLELGYSASVTNVYDDATFAAVKAFQNKNGLTVDGYAGSQTFAVLRGSSARRATDAALTYSTLRIDDTGSEVTSLQKALKSLGYSVTVNGAYDVATHNAVVAFQQRNGLVISGIADALTRTVLHSGGGKNASTPVEELPAGTGKITGPSVSQIKLLHWQNEIKPNVKAGQAFTVFDPNTGLSWKLVFYSLGRHADSQPASWRDTQIMNRSFGSTSWTIHPVYVLLPTGQWTMATMHNRPHLYGSITDNGFGGHLCVHFLRDMAEAQKNDPNYGVNNQVTLRNAWKALTGETVN